MADQNKDADDEIKRNYAAFVAKLPQLLPTHQGKFALMHAGEIDNFFDTAGDAYKVGMANYGTGNFSIQEVTDAPVDLGFFNHAISERPV